MYEGFFLDLLLTAAISIVPTVTILLVSGPIYNRKKAFLTCFAIFIFASIVVTLIMDLNSVDKVPKYMSEIFYGFINLEILHYIPLKNYRNKHNGEYPSAYKGVDSLLISSADGESIVQNNDDNTSAKDVKKSSYLKPILVVSILALFLTNIIWFITYTNLQEKQIECETKVMSLEKYVDSLKSQLKDAQADAEEYTEADRLYEEYLERAEKNQQEWITKWNENNPDQPLDPETGQPL